MRCRELLLASPLLLLAGLNPVQTHAQSYNALEECIALSPLIDDIHLCMDNYLDLMDGSLQNITDFIADSLDEQARAGLENSQQAFIDYRRQNCLWYLEFSSPRAEAEQIAKNCLATMSQQRLAELEALLRTDDGDRRIISGFYVYGSERNSFQPCGSRSRYWLEGDNSQVGLVQQEYLSTASSELQVLFASFTGEIDEQAVAPQGHQGVFELSSLVDLRVPTEGDCLLPATTLRTTNDDGADVSAAVSSADQPSVEALDSTTEDAEEQLIGYFGDWLADCTAMGGVRGCRLSVDMATAPGIASTRLSLVRRQDRQTGIEVFFSEREIDSPLRIRWSVDGVDMGDLVQSEIRVDQAGTRQLLSPNDFVREELVPMLMRGNEVIVEVLENVDDAEGDVLVGSLIGLTDALTFADDFIRGGSL